MYWKLYVLCFWSAMFFGGADSQLDYMLQPRPQLSEQSKPSEAGGRGSSNATTSASDSFDDLYRAIITCEHLAMQGRVMWPSYCAELLSPRNRVAQSAVSTPSSPPPPQPPPPPPPPPSSSSTKPSQSPAQRPPVDRLIVQTTTTTTYRNRGHQQQQDFMHLTAVLPTDGRPAESYAPANGGATHHGRLGAKESSPTNDGAATFDRNLLQLITSRNQGQGNVIYSPISLRTILALIYTGATGQTAKELGTALTLPSQSDEVLQQFRNLLKSQHSNDIELQMINKVYHDQRLLIDPLFRNNAANSFAAEVEGVAFAQKQRAANIINEWVAQATHQRIRNVVQAEGLGADTTAVLVNAIYLKAKWLKEFPADDTFRGKFAVGGVNQKTKTVNMMANEDTFRYLELNSIGAKVIELPYANTTLSMLLILPNEINGLAAVEARLHEIDFRQLPAQMPIENVQLQVPKFRFEYEIDMVATLRQLGINALFTDRAELGNMFTNRRAGVSKVQHKAFILINETGTEVAAATFVKFIPLSLPMNVKRFVADHPFIFVIRSPQAVYFVGHVVNP